MWCVRFESPGQNFPAFYMVLEEDQWVIWQCVMLARWPALLLSCSIPVELDSTRERIMLHLRHYSEMCATHTDLRHGSTILKPTYNDFILTFVIEAQHWRCTLKAMDVAETILLVSRTDFFPLVHLADYSRIE